MSISCEDGDLKYLFDPIDKKRSLSLSVPCINCIVYRECKDRLDKGFTRMSNPLSKAGG